MKKMFRKRAYVFVYAFSLFCLSFFTVMPVTGNNIRINVPVKVSAGTGDTLVLEFPLQWDNSWRDEFNWDAAWVFLKYKVGTGDWKHVPLSFGGHSFNDVSGQPVHFDYMSGQTGSNTLGLFVYRSRPDITKMPEITCKLKCLKSALGGMDAGKFASHEAFIRAQAVEMVYVPYGAYYLGDDVSNKSFTKTEKIFYGPIPESSDIVNNTSGYVMTASHAVAGCPATNAADHVNNPIHGATSWYTQTTASCWWKIDFKAGKTVRFFGVSGASNYPSYAPSGTWYLEGSNDDLNWTKLNTMAASIWRAPSVSYPVQQSIRVANPGAYRYYRLNFPQSHYTMAQNIAMTEDLLYPLDNTVGDLVDSETARSLNPGGLAISVPDAFPKGYKGFYTMKYELSQEQYVAFLNTLTYAQQQERIPGLASMKEGDYVFGDRTQPSNRNGICVAVASFNGLPVLFANNLTNDGKYAQDNDGKTVACNYLSPNDMLAYCSWSGLRPMSEMEYEKTCRPIYPELALSKGYAWNTTSVPGRLSSVNNGGQKDEKSGTSGANVNAGNTFGPVRCGLFATTTPTSNQQTAGATFWGVMEMSGNLRELCYNVNAASTFNGGVLGDGTYALNKWNNAVANFGARGGGFSSPDSILWVSDRTEATGYFTSLEQHDSTVTFRGVYPIAGAVDAGTIAVVSVCPDKIGIKSVTDASSKFDLSYMWYVQKPGSSVWEMIPGETGAIISGYDVMNELGTVASQVYKFKRKAVALVGEATTAVLSVTVPNMKLTVSLDSAQIDVCDNSTLITASILASGTTYQWTWNNKTLSIAKTYTPVRSNFDNNPGNYAVTCIATASGCTTEQQLNVYISNIQTVASTAVTMQNCGEVNIIDPQDGKSYCTVKIGTQCWLGKNYDRETGTYLCYEAKYGKVYNYATVHKADFCPAGWHVPDDADWNTLVAFLGATHGKRMKAVTPDWDGDNTSGFNALPGGANLAGWGNPYGKGGQLYMWRRGKTAPFRLLSGSNVWDSYDGGMSSMYYVRCLRD